MPTYEYKCLKCNYVFEEFQKMTDKPLTKCPKCKGKVKRLIGTGLTPIFKGSGFYETDYKKNTNGKKTTTKSSAKKETATAKTKSTKENS